MQLFHISNCTMCFSKKILYQYFAVAFALLGAASPLKTLYVLVLSSKILKKIETTPDNLN